MHKLYKIYAITSILTLIVLISSPVKDSMSGWRRHVKAYNKILSGFTEKEETVPKRLQQIWVRDLDRVDRCVTCHLGMTQDRMKDASLPYRTHSGMFHDVNALGCTICHQGQGLATEYHDIHLPSESWDDPVLPNRYLESTCGRCHIDENLWETPHLNRGRTLVQDYKCIGCHDHPRESIVFTPTHIGIGNKVMDREWLISWLKGPGAIRPKTKMPDFYLSDVEARGLSDFLMSLQAFPDGVIMEPLPMLYTRNQNDEAFITEGRTLFRETTCTSCHELGGNGGTLSSDLEKVGSKAKAIWIYNFLKSPQAFQPGIEMPQFGFTTVELASLTAYLSAECIDWDTPWGEEDYVSGPDSLEYGENLYYHYNCGGCHQTSKVTLPQNRGPQHTFIGSKKDYQIWFGEASVPQPLHDYFEAKLKSPRIFGESMRMPGFNLQAGDRLAVTTYLLSLRDENLPEEYMRRGVLPAPFHPQGRVGEVIEKYSCLKCHAIAGDGGAIGPDLSRIGNRLNRNWLRTFLREPVSRRPLIDENMLQLSISTAEIETLLDYANSVLLDDSLTVPEGWRPSREAGERGRQLYRETYGCQSCHMIDGTGGFLGPVLDHVGDRLTSGWMVHWLLDPQKYIPETIEPKTGMSMEDALDVVAYLLTL